MNKCVMNPVQNVGGVARDLGTSPMVFPFPPVSTDLTYPRNLGKAKLLLVEIWKQKPAVQCVSTQPASAPLYQFCKEAIDKMPWSEDLIYFGKSGVPSVQVPVPKVIASGECIRKITYLQRVLLS